MHMLTVSSSISAAFTLRLHVCTVCRICPNIQATKLRFREERRDLLKFNKSVPALDD